MTVGELLGRISSRELTEWIAYAQMEPFGEERADLRSGIVAATVANANRDPKQRRKPFEPEEFMPKFSEPKEKKEPAEVYDAFRQWARFYRKPIPQPNSPQGKGERDD